MPLAAAPTSVAHHLTVDVEEYFHVSAMEPFVPREAWPGMASRLEVSMDRCLGMFDDFRVKGTFFVLGVVARDHPEVVRRLAREGHEVASHGWDHRRVTHLTPDAFRIQVRESRALLEDLTGSAVLGYRAPSFSIVPGREWALDILVEEGYRYDSSLYPVRRPGYGYPSASRHVDQVTRPPGELILVPPATLKVLGQNLPAGGGGYLRQLPLTLTRRALAALAAEGEPGTLYFHPWELDPDQPRIPGPGWLTRIRHYRGLDRMEARLRALMSEFSFRPVREGVDGWAQERVDGSARS